MEFIIADAVSAREGLQANSDSRRANVSRGKDLLRRNISQKFPKRDDMLMKSTLVLADAYANSNRQEQAVRVLEDLRRMSMSLPSGTFTKLQRHAWRVWRRQPTCKKLSDEMASAPV
jgi:hypothetical protein